MTTLHFLAECLSTPWALQPERMAAYAQILARSYARKLGSLAGEEPTAAAAGPQRQAGDRRGAIAVIGVYGTIMQRSSQINICDGGTSTQAISSALRQANADDSVGSILLDIDSPGGSVYGLAELAAEIRSSDKPVTAIANSLAASAAYWLGSAAGEFFVTPGGEVGSIGVWMAHEDWSKAMTEAGVDVTMISAGKYKTEGNPYQPLGDDAKGFMQSRVDDYYGAFTRDVARGRQVAAETVRTGMGQGRVLGASQAQAEKMVDGVMTFDQVVRKMQKAMAAPKGRNAAEQNRQRLALLALE